MSVYFIHGLNIIQGSGSFAARFVLSLFALEIGATPWIVGALAALYSMAAAFGAVPVGRLADSFGPRWILFTGSAGVIAGMLLAYLTPSLTTLLISSVLCGLSVVCYNVTVQNLTGLLSKRDDRARNFSNYSLTNSMAWLFGPLIGGFAIDHFGHRASCLYLSLFACVPLAILLIRWKALGMPGLRSASKSETRSEGGTLALFRDVRIRNTIVTASFLSSGLNMFSAYMPVYGHSLKLSASVIGMIMATNATASILIRVVLPMLIRKLHEQRTMALSFCFGAVGLFLIPTVEHPFMLGLLAFIFGLGMGAGQPIVTMLIFQFSPAGRSGEAIGLKVTANHLTTMVSPLFFGAVATAFGLMPMFWLNGALMLMGFHISWGKRW